MQNGEELKFIPKLKDSELKPIYQDYVKHAKIHPWIKLPLILIGLGTACYNFFIAGKTYTISEYNKIMNIVQYSIGIIVFILIVFGFIAIKESLKIKSQIKELARKYNYPKKELLKEFNLIFRSVFGGLGV